MRESFRQDLKDLKMEVLLIGRIIVGQHARTPSRRSSRATWTSSRRSSTTEDEIDRRCLGVEERSLEIIATQFPVARDLRLLHSLTYIAMHMERMGDLDVNIAKAARRTASRKGPADALRPHPGAGQPRVPRARGDARGARALRPRARAQAAGARRADRPPLQAVLPRAGAPARTRTTSSGRARWCSRRATSSASRTTRSTSASGITYLRDRRLRRGQHRAEEG